uniref:Myb/SANT-like DNA-binding domain-containing protein n=1 Tax=Graphocephala atropunctata TaxID=36148 RepID=A0A1B6L984_9HEMI
MEEENGTLPDEEESLSGTERNAWDRQSVYLLIREYKRYKKEFSDPELKKRNYWEKVSNNLSVSGYNFDIYQCEKKWRNLKKTFRENEGKQVINWPFFNVLKDLFSSESNNKQENALEDYDDNATSLPEVDMDFYEESDPESVIPGDSEDSLPPSWFLDFLAKYKEDEVKKMKMLEDMHNDIVVLEKRKCALLKTLIDKLS